MPLIPVPRWRPAYRYAVSRRYLDALPVGWSVPSLPNLQYNTPRWFAALDAGTSPPKTGVFYEAICLTPKEQLAGCIASYGPRGLVGVWQPVPRSSWSALAVDHLHLVRAHRVNEKEPDPQNASAGFELWQYPYWYRNELPAVYKTVDAPVRVDWDSIAVTATRVLVRPARTLEDVFSQLGVAFDYRELPVVTAPEPKPYELASYLFHTVLQLHEPTTYSPDPDELLRSRARPEERVRLKEAARQGWKEAYIASQQRSLEKTIEQSQNPRIQYRERSITASFPENGPLSEAVGLPGNIQPGSLALLAGATAVLGAPGEICFACDQRDIHSVWVHIRTGPPEPSTGEEWLQMEALLARLTAAAQ